MTKKPIAKTIFEWQDVFFKKTWISIMDRLKSLALFSGILLFLSQTGFTAEPIPSQLPFYVSANAGVFQGTFNTKYIDLTDTIQQNVAETVQQKGYIGSIGFGYSKRVCENYFLGGELDAAWMTNSANLQIGASSLAFTDKITLRNYYDLVFVPGVFFTPSFAGYLKLGASLANITDTLNTPVSTSFVTNMVSSNASKTALGFTGALGVKKWLTPKLSLFVEYNYRDYGSVNFANFQNYTATYTHSARVYGESIFFLGLNYQLG